MGRLSIRPARLRLGLAAAALLAAVTAWACADGTDPPSWELAKDYFDAGGSSAMLTPGNDTRVNLLLLLADRRGAPVRDPAAKTDGPPLALFPWRAMSSDAPQPPARPASPSGESAETGSRCQSNAAGSAAFAAAVRANPRIPEDEKATLVAARTGFTPDCWAAAPPSPAVAVSSPAASAFAAYLAAAADFYGERFDIAGVAFAALDEAPDPWLRETAAYMVARTALNRAQKGSLDEYGWLPEPEKRDRAGIAAAGTAFAAYLKAYPTGLYAASARGLQRRVAWLASDSRALAAAYDRQVATRGPLEGAATPARLAEEIDLALLASAAPADVRDPLLLAVVDLQRMRCDAHSEADDAACEQPRLDRAALAAQAPLFAGEPALFAYLQAAEAFHVRGQPSEVLKLIPDAARQKRFTYLAFSRQMLRGMALEAVRDGNARAFWLSLWDGATQLYQREALQLAIALHDERAGRVDRIFAPESRITHPVMRQILIEDVAGPDLLRQQARDANAPKQERDVATFVLLAKDLRRGFYRDFLEDIRLMPAGVSAQEGWTSSARQYDAWMLPQLQPPPLSRFLQSAPRGDAGCPALTDTVRQLAAAPKSIPARLCLAEYFRSNGFDGFETEWRIPGRGLGSSQPQFPGAPYQRLEVYKAVIADPAATPDQRALALNRAVRCYGPVGYNSCGGTEVPIEQRRAWFQQLKRDHPDSRWATSLKYFW
jgi:hypothetical protein